MGNQKSSSALLERDNWSQVMCDMESKYGEESLSCLAEWAKLGYPETGSLDVKQLLELGKKLKKAERKMMAKKKIKTKCVANCTHHMKVFEMWKCESEERQRKSNFKELPQIDSLNYVNELPPPLYYARDPYSPVSMCPPQMLSCVDPGLTCYPPLTCHPPPTSKQQPCSTHLPTPTHAGGMQQAKTFSEALSSGSRPPPVQTQQQEHPRSHQPPLLPYQQQKQHPTAGSSRGNLSAPDTSHDILQLPMLEVVDPFGDILLVQRFWSPDEISQFAKTLKNPEELGGQSWQEELQAFCRTYRPTMREILSICAKSIEPSKMNEIMTAVQLYVDMRPISPHYDHNYNFLAGVRVLCNEILRLFPTRVNLEAVQSCQQKKDEHVSDFYHRLQTALNTHGGFEDVHSPIAKSYMTSLLLTNMHEHISTAVKTSLIEAEFSEPAEVLRHARHAEKRAYEKNKQRQTDTRALQLLMTEAQVSMQEALGRINPPANQLAQTIGQWDGYQDDSSEEDWDSQTIGQWDGYQDDSSEEDWD